MGQWTVKEEISIGALLVAVIVVGAIEWTANIARSVKQKLEEAVEEELSRREEEKDGGYGLG